MVSTLHRRRLVQTPISVDFDPPNPVRRANIGTLAAKSGMERIESRLGSLRPRPSGADESPHHLSLRRCWIQPWLDARISVSRLEDGLGFQFRTLAERELGEGSSTKVRWRSPSTLHHYLLLSSLLVPRFASPYSLT